MIEPKIKAALDEVLLKTTALHLDNCEATEVYLHALVSIALDAGDGDRRRAAQWIDEWLLPNIHDARDRLSALGGTATPHIIDGKRVN